MHLAYNIAAANYISNLRTATCCVISTGFGQSSSLLSSLQKYIGDGMSQTRAAFGHSKFEIHNADCVDRDCFLFVAVVEVVLVITFFGIGLPLVCEAIYGLSEFSACLAMNTVQ